MREFRKVLFVSQGIGDETEALRQALSLARNNGAELHALIVCPPFPKGLAQYRDGYEKSLADQLDQAIRNAQSSVESSSSLRIARAVECGRTPAIRIIRHVLRDAFDLVVKQAEKLEGRFGWSAVDMQLLRQCPCPVWLCRPIAHSRGDIRVAVAIDPIDEEPAGRDLALRLLQMSRALADTCSGELAVISCWDHEYEEYLRHQPWIHVTTEEVSRDVENVQREHRAALDAAIGESGIGGRIEVHHVRGRPDHLIPKLIEVERIDVLVMGTVARTGIPGFVIGNTAENVLRGLDCSLLVLKPHGFVSDVKAYE